MLVLFYLKQQNILCAISRNFLNFPNDTTNKLMQKGRNEENEWVSETIRENPQKISVPRHEVNDANQ